VNQLEHAYIRGSKIRFLVIPDMLKNAPMFKRIDPKAGGRGGRGGGGGGGGGRGAGGGGGGGADSEKSGERDESRTKRGSAVC
jgi:small nuclear ribonucleoprotein D3